MSRHSRYLQLFSVMLQSHPSLVNLITTIVTASGSAVAVVMLIAKSALEEKIKDWVTQASLKRTEELRSNLGKTGTDYAIYAQKRHSAIALLYAELLEAQYLVGGTIKKPYSSGEKRSLQETAGLPLTRQKKLTSLTHYI